MRETSQAAIQGQGHDTRYLRAVLGNVAEVYETHLGRHDAELFMAESAYTFAAELGANAIRKARPGRPTMAHVAREVDTAIAWLDEDVTIAEASDQQMTLLSPGPSGARSRFMMNLYLFGHIAADALGYVRVVLHESAPGSNEPWKIVIHTSRTGGGAEFRSRYRLPD